MDNCPARIGILLHEFDPFPRAGLLSYLAAEWQAAGHEVVYFRGIPEDEPAVDVLIPHVDVTVTPADYLDFIAGFPVVVNRRLLDISKRKVSSNLLAQDDDWQGEVIVKTDRNFGGIPELTVELYAAGAPFGGAIHQRPWRKVEQIIPAQYPVFSGLSDVPPGVWRNPNLVVEKFLAEREGDLYCHRVALVMGDVVLCQRVYGKTRVIKGRNLLRSEPVDPPAELAEIRERFGMDYGKVDFAVRDGQVHVFDVNNTPSGLNNPEVDARIGKQLAPGIEVFLPD